MARRVVVALLGPVSWTPPGIDPTRWRKALAEDVVDLLATLNEVEVAVAVPPGDRWLADAVVWPGTVVYEVPEPTANAVFAALAADRAAPVDDAGWPDGDVAPAAGRVGQPGDAGAEQVRGDLGAGTEPARYDQAAVVVADAPDLPGLTLGKLLRPLSSRPVAVAPAEGNGPGLLGVAARLPVPEWLPEVDLSTAAPADVRAAAPRPGDVAVTAGWHRLRGPADLAALDPALDGWDATRALLSPPSR
ncbi:hypothetical protein [Micromonospora narathiwatensis]|uniref:Uncharacterized protein n=1 Tax=Micromonospora narathiwatensis TaxID=299146 RepID=A0A1A9A419_9ACTN|nr:hypothetical protein [Micromonospora narathiwatensis]SBT50923.1 hypothetical protein GA0070621_3877 [Micromonospora narathiwatensis]